MLQCSEIEWEICSNGNIMTTVNEQIENARKNAYDQYIGQHPDISKTKFWKGIGIGLYIGTFLAPLGWVIGTPVGAIAGGKKESEEYKQVKFSAKVKGANAALAKAKELRADVNTIAELEKEKVYAEKRELFDKQITKNKGSWGFALGTIAAIAIITAAIVSGAGLALLITAAVASALAPVVGSMAGVSVTNKQEQKAEVEASQTGENAKAAYLKNVEQRAKSNGQAQGNGQSNGATKNNGQSRQWRDNAERRKDSPQGQGVGVSNS